MKKTSTDRSSEKPTLRQSISRLKAILRLKTQSYTHSEYDFDSFLTSIDALPISRWKKLVLLRYYDPDGQRETESRYSRISIPARSKPRPLESRNRPEARYWRISALEERIRRSLPKTKETKKFLKLWRRGVSIGFAQSIAQTAAPGVWEIDTKYLQDRYEKDGNLRAVEIMAGATEGSQARPKWVSEAMAEAEAEEKQINLKGSGRIITRTRAEGQKQSRESSRKFRKNIEKVKIQIKKDLFAEEEKIRKLPRVQNPRKEIAVRQRKVLRRYLARKNPHDRTAAKQILKELKKAESK